MIFKKYFLIERKLDLENRLKAKEILLKIIEKLPLEKPNKSPQEIFYWIDPDYETIKLSFRPESEDFHAQFQAGSYSTIIIYVPKEIFTKKLSDKQLNKILQNTLENLKEPLFHEIIHMLDNARFDTSKGLTKDYINSPTEFNAYFQMTAQHFDELLEKAISEDNFEKYFGSSGYQFIEKFLSKLEETRPGTVKGIQKEKSRWYKRIYQLYTSLLKRFNQV